MSDFMFLFRGGMPNLSPAETQARMQKWIAWMEDLREKGHFVSSAPLERATGKVVHGGKKTVTDGPFAEAKDVVGGYLIVNARDLAHATELSMGCPLLMEGSDGTVEVRTVLPVPTK